MERVGNAYRVTDKAQHRSRSPPPQPACDESVQPCLSRRTYRSHSGRCDPQARCLISPGAPARCSAAMKEWRKRMEYLGEAR
jgi:hypothetical protein